MFRDPLCSIIWRRLNPRLDDNRQTIREPSLIVALPPLLCTMPSLRTMKRASFVALCGKTCESEIKDAEGRLGLETRIHLLYVHRFSTHLMMYLAPQGKNSREDGDIEFGSDGTQGKPPREKLKGEVEIKLNRKKV